jgi:hypothetical protein
VVGEQQWKDSLDYGKLRDEVADQQWKDSVDYNK